MESAAERKGVVAGFLMPPPPALLPEIGRDCGDEIRNTREGCARVALRLASFHPDTIVIISPHAPLFRDYLYVYDNAVLSGSLSRFGAPGLRFSAPQDNTFVGQLKSQLAVAGIPSGTPDISQVPSFGNSGELDHGVLVPLSYILEKNAAFNLVALSSSAFDVEQALECGRILAETARMAERRVCVVASGDLSHKVNRESPYGMVREGEIFDAAVTNAIRAGLLEEILAIPADVRDAAGECGYRSLVMLLGALGVRTGSVSSEVYSYQAPYGIGYCNAAFVPERVVGEKPSSSDATEGKSGFDPVRIARKALDAWVRRQERLDAYALPASAQPRSGCFVSLHAHGDLRGCIGTISATMPSIEEEIIRNAIAACSEDPRFPPVRVDELDELDVKVDILGEAEPVASKDDLDPVKYGVIVTSGFRRGLLLPDLEGVETVTAQLSIACRKGGIDPDEEYSIQRFQVTRYEE